MTMARKTTPMTVLKVPPITGKPSEGILFVTYPTLRSGRGIECRVGD